MSGVNRAAEAQAKISADTLAWYKEKDAADRPMREKLQQQAYDTAAQQAESARTQDALAADYANYNKTTFRPLEQGIVADAQAYDTPEKRNAASTAALADTNMAFDSVNKARTQQLAASGIDPGSARAMSVMQGQDVAQATSGAGAAYKARQGVETIGRAMKMDAAGLGRGLASNQATSAGLALQAGNSAVSNTGIPLSASQSATALMGQGFSRAANANAQAGNMYTNIAGIQQKAGEQSSGLMGALGSVAGAYAGSASGSTAITGLLAMSDENMKTDIEPVSDKAALDAVNATPVKQWKYDPAKMAEKGLDIAPEDAGTNIGPMAQDVNKNMGDGAAPDGKKLNLVTMNGIAMKSIQALDKKVTKLTKLVSAASHAKQGASA